MSTSLRTGVTQMKTRPRQTQSLKMLQPLRQTQTLRESYQATSAASTSTIWLQMLILP